MWRKRHRCRSLPTRVVQPSGRCPDTIGVMKLASALFAFALAAPMMSSPARADVPDLGGIKLGQKYKKAKPKKVTLYGCVGQLHSSAPDKGKDKGKLVNEV